MHLLGEEFLQDIIDETNRYGDAKKNMRGTNIGKASRFSKWVHTNREELLDFLGIVINMGLVSKSSMKAYWNVKDWSQSPLSFPLVFIRERFFMMQSVLHFPQLPGHNSKLRKVQGIVQHFSQQFQTYYIQKQHVSIDESLIRYEGCAPAIQYLPNKHHHRFGFKLFCLCESEAGHIVNFTIYEGKGSHVSEHGISHDTCIELLGPLYGMSYHLYTDNWYTAVPLAETFLAENTNLTGTMPSNRKFLPPDVK